MKMIKKVLNLILILALIQLFCATFLCSKTYASGESITEKIFDQSRNWKNMGEGNVNQVLQNASNVNSAITDIGNFIRVIGVAVLVVYIAFLFISLSHNNGADIAHAKLKIGITTVLVIMFIFAEKIMEFLIGIADQFESIM